jgi:hypothetical protein
MFTYRVMQRLLRPLCCAALLVGAYSAQASDIRQFSLKTTENLGRELYEQTQRASILSEPQQRAKRAAMAALPQLEKQGYRFIVLNDPERKGYLVYALATTRDPRDVIIGLHYRVSVSANGKVERVDPLARSAGVISGNGSDLPRGTHRAGFYSTCMVSTRPTETFVYLTLLHNQPCAVATSDGAIWFIENGKITKDGKASSAR